MLPLDRCLCLLEPHSLQHPKCKALLNIVDFIDIVRALVERGADVNVDKDGNTPLHRLAASYRVDFVVPAIKVLIDAGADINRRADADGRTPLHVAVAMKITPNVKLLLESGAGVSTTK